MLLGKRYSQTRLRVAAQQRVYSNQYADGRTLERLSIKIRVALYNGGSVADKRVKQPRRRVRGSEIKNLILRSKTLDDLYSAVDGAITSDLLDADPFSTVRSKNKVQKIVRHSGNRKSRAGIFNKFCAAEAEEQTVRMGRDAER